MDLALKAGDPTAPDIHLWHTGYVAREMSLHFSHSYYHQFRADIRKEVKHRTALRYAAEKECSEVPPPP